MSIELKVKLTAVLKSLISGLINEIILCSNNLIWNSDNEFKINFEEGPKNEGVIE